MRNGQSGRRRGRGGGGRPAQSGSRPMESGSRNDARIRGNAQQLLEKYKSLARDATSAGDRILAEYYMQHADHYHRVLAEFRSRYEDTRPRERDERDDRDHDDVGYDDEAPEVSVPQGYSKPPVQRNLNLEPAAEVAEPAAPAEAPVADAAPEAPAEEAVEAPAEEEKPRRRRGRPRKVKPEAEGEASPAENAA
ncbi:MAG TPA: DUF4167 domain-containing protein [Pedomonas sp.]|uniref:DUF4167 domain-containing protein n=1 Tax=Pedomonas sp. TaxID=2976421 RepID=UPI002F4040A9